MNLVKARSVALVVVPLAVIASLCWLANFEQQTVDSFSASATSPTAATQVWLPTDPGDGGSELALQFDATISSLAGGRFTPILTVGPKADLVRDQAPGRDGSLYVNPEGQISLMWSGRELTVTTDPNLVHKLRYVVDGGRAWVILDGAMALATPGGGGIALRPAPLVVGPSSSKLQLDTYSLSVEEVAYRGNLLTVLAWLLGGVLLLAWAAIGTAILARRVFLPIVAPEPSRVLKYSAATVALVSLAALIGTKLALLPSQFVAADNRFSDYFDLLTLNIAEPYSRLNSNYPPFGVTAFKAIAWLPERVGFLVFLTLCVGAIWGATLVGGRVGPGLRGAWPGVVLCFNFPLIFAVDRGNADLLSIAALIVGLLLVLGGQLRRGALTVGLASAFKLYPIVFLLPLLSDRRRRPFVLASVGVTFGVTYLVGPFVGTDPLGAIAKLSGAGDTSFLPLAQRESWGMSLPTLILTSVDHLLPGSGTIDLIDELLNSSSARLALLALLASCVLLSTLEVEWWRKFAFVALGLILFTPVTFQYKGLLLIVPILFLNLASRAISSPRSKGVLFGLLLSPVGFVMLGSGTVTISSIVLPIIGIVLLSLLLFDRHGNVWTQKLRRVELRTSASHVRAIVTAVWTQKLRQVELRVGSTILLAVGAVLLLAGMGARAAPGPASWELLPGGSTAALSRAVTGLGGTVAHISPSHSGSGIDFIDAYFRSVNSGVECPAAVIYFRPDTITIDIAASDSTAAQHVAFPTFGATDVSLTLVEGGGAFVLATNQGPPIRTPIDPTCLDFAYSELNPHRAEASITVIWGDESRGWTSILIGVGVLALIVGFLMALQTTLRGRLRREGLLK